MAGSAAAPIDSDIFTRTQGFQSPAPIAETPTPISFQTSSYNTFDTRDFTLKHGVRRRSTDPKVISKAVNDYTFETRRAQTVYNARDTTNYNTHPSERLRRFLFRKHRDFGSAPPGQSYTRQSTIDTKHSESFEQTKPWDRKAVLSLDGGGIRGYSALLILKALMTKIEGVEKSWEEGQNAWEGPALSSYHPVDPVQDMATDSISETDSRDADHVAASKHVFLPSHYFDYMAGTSTGGLISIMLGRLRMNVDDCIQEYETLGEKVFAKCRWLHIRSIPPLWLPREKYNHEKLQTVIQDLINRRIPQIGRFPGGKTFAFDENRCRVVVVAYQENPGSGAEQTYLFRTYKNLRKPVDPNDAPLYRNPGPAHDIPIWEVARATSAAPGYFKEVTIDGLRYLDGGFGANNPCLEIFQEVRNLNNNDKNCMGCVLSLGTGKNKEKRMQSKTGFREVVQTGLGKFLHYENFARKWASDSEGPHTTMLGQWNSSDKAFLYRRLNVEEGLARMKLDEWSCRGPTRTAVGRCIGRCNRRMKSKTLASKNAKSSRGLHEEKARRLTEDNDSDSDQSTSSGSTTGSDDLETFIPKRLRPVNKTLDTIRRRTEEYLAQDDCQTWLQECAVYLVRNRRARVETDLERWQKTCFGTWYQCQVRGCPRGQKEYPDRHTMEKHLLDKHRNEFSKKDDQAKLHLEQTLREYKVTVY